MKKELKPKKLRKLTLNRETLRNLSERELQIAVGGATLRCSNMCTGASCYC